jgi:hypothetical protein
MQIAADGSFEVTFSSEPQPGNWMGVERNFRGGAELPDQYPMASGGLMLRTYYWDPEDGLPQGQFHLERVDDKAPLGPAPLAPSLFAQQLESAAQLCSKAAKWWIGRASRMRAQNPPNKLAPLGTTPPGVENFTPPKTGPLNYGVCAFDLAPQHRQTSLSFKQAHVDGDGKFRCVVAHADPGVPNWLDTGSNRRGFIFYRWLRPNTDLPSPVGRLVKLNEVRALMPPDHPHVDQATRRGQLSARRAWFARRFQT